VAEHLGNADHLPKRRQGGQPTAPPELPRQRRGTTPQGRGRYPDFDVLDEAGHWDELTRRAVLDRVENVPAIRFFDPSEAATLGAFCDVVLAQHAEPRIPVLAMVDDKLHSGRLDGYQHDDMPDDRDTWRRASQGLDAEAGAHGAATFADAQLDAQRAICQRFADAELTGGVWDELPVAKAWSVIMRAVLSAFYSHPWAWNEIGFGGPAHPRGYSRMGIGLREEWEGKEAFAVDPVTDVAGRGLE